jgi:hypothetical protein
MTDWMAVGAHDEPSIARSTFMVGRLQVAAGADTRRHQL